jgi:hypothetical protein
MLMISYTIDPALISLDEFRELTEEKEMLPGRLMLQERMDECFTALKASGIRHLGDLFGRLSTRIKVQEFSRQSGLSMDYLVLLKREAGSYLAKPFPLSDIPGIPFEYLELLKSRGLKNTRDLFEQVPAEEQQAELSSKTGIPVYRLKEMYSLCDLSRITGVGGIFARVLYEAGIRSPEEYASTEAPAVLERCRQIIRKYGYPAGKLGIKDMQYGINYARVVSACDFKLAKK